MVKVRGPRTPVPQRPPSAPGAPPRWLSWRRPGPAQDRVRRVGLVLAGQAVAGTTRALVSPCQAWTWY